MRTSKLGGIRGGVVKLGGLGGVPQNWVGGGGGVDDPIIGEGRGGGAQGVS